MKKLFISIFFTLIIILAPISISLENKINENIFYINNNFSTDINIFRK
jgi:hypothetical protein